MVGVRGLEPPAPWSQTKYSNHTELHPDLIYGGIIVTYKVNVKSKIECEYFYCFFDRILKQIKETKESKLKIFIKSNMLIIQTDSSILSIDWFGDFLLSHSRDTIFMPMSVVTFLDEKLMKERKQFLEKLAKLYSEKSSLYYEQLLKNFLRYKLKPIKIEFKQETIIKSDFEIYLDAISHKEVRILFKDKNPWVYTFFFSQLDKFITESDQRNLYLNASGDRSKSRLDRVLKKRTILFFNIKLTYSKGFLTILFNEYTKNSRKKYNRDNSFNSSNYRTDSQLLHHYGVLDLQYGANIDTIKINYKKLAKMYHPDRVHYKNETLVNLYTKKFQDIQASYEFLKNYFAK